MRRIRDVGNNSVNSSNKHNNSNNSNTTTSNTFTTHSNKHSINLSSPMVCPRVLVLLLLLVREWVERLFFYNCVPHSSVLSVPLSAVCARLCLCVCPQVVDGPLSPCMGVEVWTLDSTGQVHPKATPPPTPNFMVEEVHHSKAASSPIRVAVLASMVVVVVAAAVATKHLLASDMLFLP